MKINALSTQLPTLPSQNSESRTTLFANAVDSTSQPLKAAQLWSRGLGMTGRKRYWAILCSLTYRREPNPSLQNYKPSTEFHCQIPPHSWTPARSPLSFLPFNHCDTRSLHPCEAEVAVGWVANWWEGETQRWQTISAPPRGQKGRNCEKEKKHPDTLSYFHDWKEVPTEE